jgi:hypothetical protein
MCLAYLLFYVFTALNCCSSALSSPDPTPPPHPCLEFFCPAWDLLTVLCSLWILIVHQSLSYGTEMVPLISMVTDALHLDLVGTQYLLIG